MSAADTSALEELHGLVATELARVIRDGEKVVDKEGEVVTVTAKPAYFAAAIKLLSDSNIKARIVPKSALETLSEAIASTGTKLPFEGEPAYPTH